MVASSINFLRIGAAAGGGIVGFAFGPLVGTTLAAVIAGPFAASGAIEVGRWAGMFAGAIGGAMLVRLSRRPADRRTSVHQHGSYCRWCGFLDRIHWADNCDTQLAAGPAARHLDHRAIRPDHRRNRRTFYRTVARATQECCSIKPAKHKERLTCSGHSRFLAASRSSSSCWRSWRRSFGSGLIDCLQNPRLDGMEKLVWVVVILFTHVLGATIYLAVARQGRITGA